MTLGAVIRERRHALGFTLRQLGDATCLSAQYLNDVEHGRREPMVDATIERLANALNTSSDYLYFTAGKLPPDIRRMAVSERAADEVFRVMRAQLAREQEERERDERLQPRE